MSQAWATREAGRDFVCLVRTQFFGRIRCLVVSAFVVFALPEPAAATNGAITQSVGAKGPVSLAMYGDPQSMFRMPASIAWATSHEVSLDVFWFQGRSTLRNALNDFESSAGSFGGSAGVYFSPGLDEAGEPSGACGVVLSRLKLGVGIYPDLAGSGEDTRYRFQTFPAGVDLLQNILFVNASFVAAFRITDWLAIGASVQPIYASLATRTVIGGDSTPLDGSPQISGVAIPGNPTYSDFLDLFGNESDSDPTTYFESERYQALHFSSTISITFSPHPRFAIGLSYRSRSVGQRFQGDARVDAGATVQEAIGGLDEVIQELFLATLPNGGRQGYQSTYEVEIEGVYVPRQIRASVNWWPTDWLLLSAEVGWIEWRRALNEVVVALDRGNNQDLNFIVGSDSLVSTLALGWRNQWVFAAAAAVQVQPDWTLRAGINYARSPIDPDRQGNSATLAISELHVSLGAGWWIWDDLQLNFLIEHAFEAKERAGLSAEAPTARGSRYSAEQWFFHFGLNFHF